MVYMTNHDIHDKSNTLCRLVVLLTWESPEWGRKSRKIVDSDSVTFHYSKQGPGSGIQPGARGR